MKITKSKLYRPLRSQLYKRVNILWINVYVLVNCNEKYFHSVIKNYHKNRRIYMQKRKRRHIYSEKLNQPSNLLKNIIPEKGCGS